jgi:hypothetical protein
MERTPGLDRPFGMPDYVLAVLTVVLLGAGVAMILG